VEQESKEQKPKINRDSLKKAFRIFKYLRPHKVIFSVGMALLLLSSFVSLVVPRLLGQIAGIGLDKGKTTEGLEFGNFNVDFSDLGTVLVVLLVIFIFQGAIAFFRVYTFAIVTEKMMLALRNDTYQQLIRMPMQFFNEMRVGDLNSRISSDITTIQETFTTTIAEFIRQVIIIVFGVAFLFFFSAKLTLFMLATIPVIVIAAVVFGRFIRKLGKETQDRISESNVIVQETLSGINAVKSFANESYEALRYGKSAELILKYGMKSAIWRGVFSTFIIIFLFGAIAFVIWQGALLLQSGELSSSLFISFLLYTAMIGGSFGGLAAQYASVQRGIGAIEKVMDLLESEREKIELNQTVEPLNLQGNIQFEDVSFHYASRADIRVLDHLSFTVKSGQQIALVGPSGAGKSTVVSMLLRFYEPVEGRVLIDGQDYRNFSLNSLRNEMAIVPQDVMLFGGSIAENIAYGKPGASDEEIREAAQQANALKFIEEFPDGMQTIVGERGIQLSGGQRQRIAIARAVLRNPRILILDEATSSLDSESERLVQDALENLMKGRTSIVIAHRLSTIRKSDLILVLEKGRLKEAGSHQELIERPDGLYRHLSELQFELNG
jgi:ABC-type multidrug transport system fused ATPase/permease subunit